MSYEQPVVRLRTHLWSCLLLTVVSCAETATRRIIVSGDTSTVVHPLMGDIAPDFSLPRLGKPGIVSLSSLDGKVVLVDFWAAWCKPCLRAFPIYEGLRARYGSRGFEVVAISLDDGQELPRSVVQKMGLTFPVAWDADRLAARSYDIRTLSLPLSFLIDRQGRVRHVHAGFEGEASMSLEREIERLLPGEAHP